MVSHRRMRFVRAQVAWMLVTVILLALLSVLTLEHFVIGSVVGLLVVTELTSSPTVTSAWRRRVKWLVRVGLLLVVYLVVRLVLRDLPAGVV